MDEHHRRSVRLDGYDYTQAGAYFVTVCVQSRLWLLGRPAADGVELSAAGWMVRAAWEELPAFIPGVLLDEFVVMPDHLHGIIVLGDVDRDVGAGLRACPSPRRRVGFNDGGRVPGQARRPAPTTSLADVVRRFKTLTTTRYIEGVQRCGWPPFPGRLWQRNYYEHIIRNPDDLAAIRRYIHENPHQERWRELL